MATNSKIRKVSVKQFIDKLKTDNTKESYKRGFKKFFEWAKLNQTKILKMEDIECDYLLDDFKDYLDGKYAGATTNIYFNAVRSWLRANKKNVTAKCDDIDKEPLVYDYIPKKHEVKYFLEEANLVYRVGYSLVAFCGLRPSDARNLQRKNATTHS